MKYEEDMINKVGKKNLKIPKESFENINRRRTDNTIVNRKITKGQTTTYKTHKIKDGVTRIILTLKME